MRRLSGWCVLPLLVAACSTAYDPLADYEELEAATILDAPTPTQTGAAYDAEAVAHGEYLVELLGCGACHTDGALIGEPRQERALAGSSIGIAYTNPLRRRHPGVVFPSNLTPDEETGLGRRSDLQISLAIRTGVDRHGDMRTPVMPWAGFAKLSAPDVDAIVAYLRSIEPVRHRIPVNVSPGQKSTNPFVHFGVYRSR